MSAERDQKKRKLREELTKIEELERAEFVKDTIAALNYGNAYQYMHSLTLEQLRELRKEAIEHVRRLTTIIEKAHLNGRNVNCTCNDDATYRTNYGKCPACKATETPSDR